MRLLFFFLFISLSTKTIAQDSLAQKMLWYSKAKPTSKLFVHFDKNIYSNNENVWLTAYLLKDEANVTRKADVMVVALIRDVDSTLILEDKYLMNRGLAFGNIRLPDSLLTGAYHFIAYTNQIRNGKPTAIFVQQVTIKTNIDPSFRVNMRINNPGKIKDSVHSVLITVTSPEGRFLPKSTAINYRYGKERRSSHTDLSGQLLFTLPKQDGLVDPNIYVKLKYQRDSTFISMALPQAKSKASVKFYPEGGNLVEGLYSTIAWEVKDQQRMPIALKAFLYKNQQPIDTIESSAYGIGKFKLKPETDANYTVKLLHDGLVDSIYHLPKPVKFGLSLTMQEAAVKDTLKLNLKTNISHQLNIRIHNFKETFLYAFFDMETNTRMVKIPLTDVPKGLATITITDSLNRPLAERLFFAHYSQDPKLTLELDSQTYDQRSKVSLKLKLSNDSALALVSIAVVQDNRIETKKMTDIESYTYLRSELSDLPIQIKGLAYQDKNYLEQILLVKGWRRYTWQDLQTVQAIDTIAKTDSLRITGMVSLKTKKIIKEPIWLAMFDSSKMMLFDTDKSGYFSLNREDLFVEPGKRLYVFVNGAEKQKYKIEITDEYRLLGMALGKTIDNEQPILQSTLVNNAELVLKSNEKSIRLKEVLIKLPEHRFAFGANACGDYVCQYNILNCPNHSFGTAPIKGKTYQSNGKSVVYEGCGESSLEGFSPVSPIHRAKEYYVNDYKDPQEPAFFSTIYWNYATLINEGKQKDINFFTSDITGKFRVIVQGVVGNEVLYADRYFEVKPKK